ncbi:hypothetical protein [Halobacillus naozhouensis]|uniref:Uncharacterized protein n=1 Tax=Halobacillus naozhouensis TaxID=554880 RepID=A0ABY8J1K9_9BACI|nr:hypothetical protein [Halobacillus naozhouensis]WFT74781.1 hypothetical protein P9989_20975 [Halobacillus naozhouensis]
MIWRIWLLLEDFIVIVSGTIRYNHNHVDFEVKLPHEEVKDESTPDPAAKKAIIDAVNRKFRVKYPSTSTLDSLHIRN